ncbi:head GIN domain-containing protein [Chloroflexota bacterium]
MKKLMVAALIVVLLTSGLLVSCGGVLIGSGNLETKDYDFNEFSKVEISSAFEFEISQSSSYSISVTADDNVIEKVQVTKEGETLKIGLKTIPGLGPVTMKATVTMPQLRGLDISGGSRGTVSDFSSNENLDLNISGASKVTGDITAGDADFEVSGASTIQLEGSANDMVAKVDGASRFNLGGFTVNDANVSFSGASSGTVNLSGKLDANLRGASKLSYIGEPTMGSINTSGASTLSKK